MLTTESLPALQQALAEAKLDGWLLFDFQGTNPIAGGMLGLKGMISRRIFVWIPSTGAPHALGHAIERGPWETWPAAWTKAPYSSWKSLESAVAAMVKGKRIAMEYSPGDAVPYLDRVPAGVLEMVRAAGATEVVSSGELVTWMQERFARAGLITDHGPNVSAGANAANPHYEPSADNPRPILDGEVLLIDLWAHEQDGMWADQTWMATLGAPSSRAQEIWSTVRDARDAAIRLLTDEVSAGRTPRGGDIDDAARAVIVNKGFGEYFTHRTGHSIDARGLHGSGPHLDNLETREDRLLIPGAGFSIEPGIYIPGEIGMRTEVNAYIEPGRAVITPREIQRELIVV